MNHLEAYSTYAEKRLAYELAKEVLSKTHSEFKQSETELVDAMLEDDVSSWNDSAGANVSMRSQFTVACNEGNVDQVEDWLQLVEGDAEPFKSTKINKSAVTALIKGKIEGGDLTPENVPEFFDLKTFPIISVRGWEKKKQELIS